MSRPTVSKAKTSYPLYSATWASSKPSHLIVGGGGGAGRHGVKNKISVFDFGSRAPEIEPCAEIDASEHDSVMSLATLGTKNGAILYAGINDSEEERLKGRNEHLKAFEVRFPSGDAKAAKGQGAIAPLSKTALFTTPTTTGAKKDGFQRVLRLSPSPRTASGAPNKRIGAVASAFAGDENEIVVFSATSNKPQNPGDVIQRIALHNKEANDLDILDEGDGKFRVAYCLNNDVYVQNIHYDFNKKKNLGKGDDDRIHAYSVPLPDVGQKKGRSTVRFLRWLTPTHILLLLNKPNRKGVELLVLRLYNQRSTTYNARIAGTVSWLKTLPSHVQAAVDMDVALLDADEEGAYQIVVAVAAIDISLTILTIDYDGEKGNATSGFDKFATYYKVHDTSITKAVFSPYIKPDLSSGRKPGPQYLRLATTSLGNSIDVETFELNPLSKKPQSRYILQSARSKALLDTAKYLVFAMIIAAIALMLQGFIDADRHLSFIPVRIQKAPDNLPGTGGIVSDAKSAANLDNADSPAVKATHRIRDLLHFHSHSHDSSDSKSPDKKALVVHHDPEADGVVSTEVHEGEHDVVKKHTDAKRWEEMEEHEQHYWREKLVEAGMWAVDEGETILKGIFFGQAGALIGRVAAEALG